MFHSLNLNLLENYRQTHLHSSTRNLQDATQQAQKKVLFSIRISPETTTHYSRRKYTISASGIFPSDAKRTVKCHSACAANRLRFFSSFATTQRAHAHTHIHNSSVRHLAEMQFLRYDD